MTMVNSGLKGLTYTINLIPSKINVIKHGYVTKKYTQTQQEADENYNKKQKFEEQY